MDEFDREPCPYRILDDCGGAFAMGCIGGGMFQAIKGFRNSPSGIKRRLASALAAVKHRAPIAGGNFALWGGVFSVIECTLIHFREKQDPWNPIISGAATGGILSARKGVPAMIGSAIVGGLLLGLIGGVGILTTKFSSEKYRNPPPILEDPVILDNRS